MDWVSCQNARNGVATTNGALQVTLSAPLELGGEVLGGLVALEIP